MAAYKSGEAEIPHSIDKIYNRISNPASLRAFTENAPSEIADKLKDVEFGDDSITFKVAPVGQIKLKLTESVPNTKVSYTAEVSPVPFGISMQLRELDANSTMAEAEINIDIPVFLKPMLDGKMNEMAQQFRSLLSQMRF